MRQFLVALVLFNGYAGGGTSKETRRHGEAPLPYGDGRRVR